MAREGKVFGAHSVKSDETDSNVVEDSEKTSGARQTNTKKISLDNVFSTPNVNPYDEVKWEKRDVVMTNWRDG